MLFANHLSWVNIQKASCLKRAILEKAWYTTPLLLYTYCCFACISEFCKLLKLSYSIQSKSVSSLFREKTVCALVYVHLIGLSLTVMDAMFYRQSLLGYLCYLNEQLQKITSTFVGFMTLTLPIVIIVVAYPFLWMRKTKGLNRAVRPKPSHARGTDPESTKNKETIQESTQCFIFRTHSFDREHVCVLDAHSVDGSFSCIC